MFVFGSIFSHISETVLKQYRFITSTLIILDVLSRSKSKHEPALAYNANVTRKDRRLPSPNESSVDIPNQAE